MSLCLDFKILKSKLKFVFVRKFKLWFGFKILLNLLNQIKFSNSKEFEIHFFHFFYHFGSTSCHQPTWPKPTQLLTPAQLARERVAPPQNLLLSCESVLPRKPPLPFTPTHDFSLSAHRQPTQPST
jgi:hypothetical protein